MSGHAERLRKDPANIVEMILNLLDQAQDIGVQVVAKLALPGSPTLILGAEPEDFQPDDDDPDALRADITELQGIAIETAATIDRVRALLPEVAHEPGCAFWGRLPVYGTGEPMACDCILAEIWIALGPTQGDTP